ncbi:MAG TPA: TusE/DsrC/DsvC family sulfur relay protein [Casimicrobiaceae bacterium]
MTNLMDEIIGAGEGPGSNPGFPHAPAGWTPGVALEAAQREGLELSEDHWQALRALQEYFAKHEEIDISMRELHDALDEKFHHKGGIKGLYLLFPGGPVAQGCRIAGLKVPVGAIDKGFGSVG